MLKFPMLLTKFRQLGIMVNVAKKTTFLSQGLNIINMEGSEISTLLTLVHDYIQCSETYSPFSIFMYRPTCYGSFAF